MSAQQDRLDREMLRSMAASFSSGLAFSFNSQDMAELMQRMSERVDPRPRIDTSSARIAELGDEIKRLEAENARLREVVCAAHDAMEGGCDADAWAVLRDTYAALDKDK